MNENTRTLSWGAQWDAARRRSFGQSACVFVEVRPYHDRGLPGMVCHFIPFVPPKLIPSWGNHHGTTKTKLLTTLLIALLIALITTTILISLLIILQKQQTIDARVLVNYTF